ncbi:hypothetical protein P7C73_g4544, partial [Tremellales sp. Uapishka_1]
MTGHAIQLPIPHSRHFGTWPSQPHHTAYADANMMLPSPRAAIKSALLVLGLVVISFVLLVNHVDSDSKLGHNTRLAFKGVVDKVNGGKSKGPSQEDLAMRGWELRRALQYEGIIRERPPVRNYDSHYSPGSGARVERFLERARSGQPFTVSAIGGSVSKGRGLSPPRSSSRPSLVPPSPRQEFEEDDTSHPLEPLGHFVASTLYSPENLHVMIFDWLNATFPNGGQNKFVNGAQGGVGAGYFGWCFKEHIPEETDLVLVELGINDLQEMDVIRKYEHLLRGLLEMDSQPAVINIETFTTLFPMLLTSSSLHQDVVAFYDIPSLSIRDVILPRILADPDTQLPRWFRTGGDVALGDDKVREWGGVAVDLMHISALGHALAAGLVIRYLEARMSTMVPTTWGRWTPSSMKTSPGLRITDVPATSLTSPFDPLNPPLRRNPKCRSMNSPKLHSQVSGTHEAEIMAEGVRGLVLKEGSDGWSKWSWKEKSYLVARDPGSIASFEFITGPAEVPLHETPLPELDETEDLITRRQSSMGSFQGGSVHIAYQRSYNYGLGSVECWVDDDPVHKKRIDGWWHMRERNMGIETEIITGLAEGPHTLHCELLNDTLDLQGRKEFRLFAIMHD